MFSAGGGPFVASISAASISHAFFSRRSFLAALLCRVGPRRGTPPGPNRSPLRAKSPPRSGWAPDVIVAVLVPRALRRRVAVAAGRRVAIVEAAPEMGEQLTDTKIFGVPL
jgi:hypothetical protein